MGCVETVWVSFKPLTSIQLEMNWNISAFSLGSLQSRLFRQPSPTLSISHWGCWEVDLISSILWNYRCEMLSWQRYDFKILKWESTYQWHTGGWEILWKHFMHINGTWSEKICLWSQSWRQGPPHCASHPHGVTAPQETAGIRRSGVWTPICCLIYLPVTGTVLEENQKMTNCFWF